MDDEDFPYPHLDPPELNDLSMGISELLAELGRIRAEANKHYEKYKKLRFNEAELRLELIDKLHESGLKSAKGEEFTASISETPEVIITSEADLRDWLENTPNIESDVYIGVKTAEFKTLARAMLKENGELANGTKVEMRESLMIRSNSKK